MCVDTSSLQRHYRPGSQWTFRCSIRCLHSPFHRHFISKHITHHHGDCHYNHRPICNAVISFSLSLYPLTTFHDAELYVVWSWCLPPAHSSIAMSPDPDGRGLMVTSTITLQSMCTVHSYQWQRERESEGRNFGRGQSPCQ